MAAHTKKQLKSKASRKRTKISRTPLSRIADRFLRDLIDHGDLRPHNGKTKVMWAVVNDRGDIVAVRKLRRLARFAASEGEEVQRVRIILEK